MQKAILFLLVLMAAISACRKGDLPEEHYFGKVSVSQVNFSDASQLDVYFGDKKIGMVEPSGVASAFMVAAGKSGKLNIYKAGTDSLVADTAIAVPANGNIDLRVIYSDLLGVKGFLSNDQSVGPDSVKIQFMYNFKQLFNNYPEVNVHVLQGTKMEDIGVVVKGLKPGKLNAQVVTLPHVKDGKRLVYYFKLEDPATGEFIKQKYLNRNFFILMTTSTLYDGHFNLAQIYDDAGDETSNKILATLSVL